MAGATSLSLRTAELWEAVLEFWSLWPPHPLTMISRIRHAGCSIMAALLGKLISMIRLKSESQTPKAPRRRLPLWVVAPVLAGITIFGWLTVERWWGHLALIAWKSQLSAKGEIFDPTRIWPPPSPGGQQFSNDFARVTGELSPGLKSFAGQYCSLVADGPGRARRGSQEPQPPSYNGRDSVGTWEQLEAQVRASAASLEAVRNLLKHPPGSLGYDILKGMEDDEPIPNCISSRVAAQALQVAAGLELHQGNLPAAGENLQALSGAVRLYEQDPTLVCYMVRVAILGLSVDAFWDALQAEGWTEPQLARLQAPCPGELFLCQLPKTMEAARVGRFASMQRLRASSYGDWVRKYEEVYKSFGGKPPASMASPRVRLWRDWVFHPIWSYAWADVEELQYGRSVQGDLEILRAAVRKKAWAPSSAQLAARHRDFAPPFCSWRFYMKLPMIESFSEVIDGLPEPPRYPYPEFARAWDVTMKNATLGEMVNTVVALKRYKLRQGKWPQSLAALVPEFATRTPVDFMDGRPLRYRVDADGSFTLYSIGLDGSDDGGDTTPDPSRPQTHNPACWDAHDWVWPRATSVGTQPVALGKRG